MNSEPAAAPSLTERQKQILQLIANDLTSTKTVDFHKPVLRQKLGNLGNAGLVRLAIRNGWIEP
jgi:DNA-binding CsgD family transcriptional regulator